MLLADFDRCTRINRFYGGNAGRKIAVLLNGTPWILKFPESTKAMRGNIASYTTSPLAEYLGSHIYALLDIPVHETVLGVRDGRLVCGCKDFNRTDATFYEFKELRNASDDRADSGYTDSPSNGNGLVLTDIIATIRTSDVLASCPGVLERFWDMFVVDAFIRNTDRNNTNWGFFVSDTTIELAPVYDNGNAFFNKRRTSTTEERSEDPALLEQDALLTVESCYTDQDRHKIKPFDYMQQALDIACNQAVRRIVPRIDLDRINALIDEIPETALGYTIMPASVKQFHKTVLRMRYEQALLPALENVKAMEASPEWQRLNG